MYTFKINTASTENCRSLVVCVEVEKWLSAAFIEKYHDNQVHTVTLNIRKETKKRPWQVAQGTVIWLVSPTSHDIENFCNDLDDRDLEKWRHCGIQSFVQHFRTVNTNHSPFVATQSSAWDCERRQLMRERSLDTTELLLLQCRTVRKLPESRSSAEDDKQQEIECRVIKWMDATRQGETWAAEMNVTDQRRWWKLRNSIKRINEQQTQQLNRCQNVRGRDRLYTELCLSRKLAKIDLFRLEAFVWKLII